MCKSQYLAALLAAGESLNQGLVAAVATHEIAHVLGLGHDMTDTVPGDEVLLSTCSPEEGFIMSPSIDAYKAYTLLKYGHIWSECSKKHLQLLAESEAWSCMGREPPEDQKHPLLPLVTDWMIYWQYWVFFLGKTGSLSLY